jgi:predicted N-formylglutamate amidohydrolase
MQLEHGCAFDVFGAENQFTGWSSFEILQGAPETGILILCDHATNLLPPEYGTLGLSEEQLNRHIAYDIGALAVARELGRKLRATVISSRFSRLLIDPNRGEDDPTLVMRLSDGAVIPGNANVTAAEIAKRIAIFYKPYHEAVRRQLDAMTSRGIVPTVISLHSFTDIWRGVPRKWHAGILWDKDPRLAVALLREMRARTGLEIGDNEPYSGRLQGDSIYQHGTQRGLPHVLVEVRQDLIAGENGQRAWGSLLAECIEAIFADPSIAPALCRVDYFGSNTDMLGKRRSL